jgi:hypothetical protein
MLDLHCPASCCKCGYSRNFLLCTIQVHPLEKLLICKLCLKWPEQREVAKVGGGEWEREGKIEGGETNHLTVRFLA